MDSESHGYSDHHPVDHHLADHHLDDPTEHLTERRRFFPTATPEEKRILHQRAQRLASAVTSHEIAGSAHALAVVSLHDELLGIHLNQVNGFATIRHVTWIPCCPPHVVGNTNLHGEIVTLIDLSSLLEIPQRSDIVPSRAVLVHKDGHTLGIQINQILDVSYLASAEMTAMPTATSTLNREFILGTAYYQQQMITILDLQHVLDHSGLIVDETVQ